MNEFTENQGEKLNMQEFSPQLEYRTWTFDDLIKEVNTFIAETNEFINGTSSESSETTNVREYGVKECADAAKSIFTPEVLSDWSKMNLGQREVILKDYAQAVGSGLNIDFKELVFERMEPNIHGYANGDGNVYLNKDLLKDPSQVIGLIDTIAHEIRHLFQTEAINNPGKFGIDQATVNEWKAGVDNYTLEHATKYDPWGYFYNPIEIDARYFGESMVRELTKDLINVARS
jgi:hypothetical protein